MENVYIPDDTRRLYLEGFVNTVCVGSTGRLGVVTHVAVSHGDWCACGFGLDGKGVWTSEEPTQISDAESFFNKLNKRFHGRLSAHDSLSGGEIEAIATKVVERLDRERHVLEIGPDSSPEFVAPPTEDLAEIAREVNSQIKAGGASAFDLGKFGEGRQTNNPHVGINASGINADTPTKPFV